MEPSTEFPSTLPVRLGGKDSAAHPVLGVLQETTALSCLVPGVLSKILSVLLDCMICTCSTPQSTLSCASLLGRGISVRPSGEKVGRGTPYFQQAAYGFPGVSCPGRECLDPLQCCLAELPPQQRNRPLGLSLR